MEKVKYKIEYQDKVISEDIPNLTSQVKILITRAIEQRLVIDPLSLWQAT